MKKNHSILSIIVSMMMIASITTSAFSQSSSEELLYDQDEKIIGTMETSPKLLTTRSLSSSYYMKDGQGIYDDNTTIRISSPIGIRFIGNKTFYGKGN